MEIKFTQIPRPPTTLLRTGSKPGAKQTDEKEMLDLAANVIYTFAVLLPDDTKSNLKLIGCIFL